MGFSYADEDLKHADMIILGNFLPEEVYAIKNNMTGRAKLGYLFCSPFGQAGCNGEVNLLGNMIELLRMGTLDYLFCANRPMVDVFNKENIKYLPSVSDFEGIFVAPTKREGILLIGNNLRTSRNFPTQLAGIKFAQQLGVEEPITSYGMDESAYEFFRDMLEIKNWTNTTQFITEEKKKSVIASSKLGLQVTYSDAFNIAAYEHAMCHVPCLISASLRWGIKPLRVAEIDNPKAIAHTIFATLNHKEQNWEKFRDEAKKAMDINFEECDKTLRRCL
jgi:hypothetical protein